MSVNSAIDEAIREANRLSSLSGKDREEQGVYASRTDLNQFIKSLRGLLKSPDKKIPLDGLIRRTADFSRRNSKLYSLTLRVVEAYEG